MQEFTYTLIFDGKPRGYCPTFVCSFKAYDYRTAIHVMSDAIEKFGERVFAAFLHDDRGAVVYHYTDPKIGERS